MHSILLIQKAVNWVMSDDPLDTVLHSWEDNVQRLSAGIYMYCLILLSLILCKFYSIILILL